MKQVILLFGLIFLFSCSVEAQPKEESHVNEHTQKVEQKASNEEPWTDADLMEPSDLAKRIQDGNADDLLILSIGFDDIIAGSTFIGPGRDQANVNKLRELLENTPKDQEVVLYCGCCPFGPCPNIRPAFSAMKELGFENGKLLNIRQNIKVNWLDLNYPKK
ncbi:MAG: rhodanese-like domain-containing protein [Brumimicrobium sp.]